MGWYFLDVEGLVRQLEEETRNEILETISDEIETQEIQESSNQVFTEIIEWVIDNEVIDIMVDAIVSLN